MSLYSAMKSEERIEVNPSTLMEVLNTPARTSYTHHVFGLITPESPTSKTVTFEAKDIKKDYESPENVPKTTLFRPWDTPESLSPASDPISPTSTLHTSPASIQQVSPEATYAASTYSQQISLQSSQHISPSTAYVSPPSFHVSQGTSYVSPNQLMSRSLATNQYISPTGSYISPSYPSAASGLPDISPSISRQQGFNAFQVPSSPILPPVYDSSPSLHPNLQYNLQSSYTGLHISPPFSLETPLNLTSPVLQLASRAISRKRKLEDIGASPCLGKKLKTEPIPSMSSPIARRPSKFDVSPPRMSSVISSPASRAPVSSPASKGHPPVCGVCGEQSTGFHYGAPVCEGCKVTITFFKTEKVFFV